MRLLLGKADIAAKVEALADGLSHEINDSWICAALMDGAFVFAADMMRALAKRGINPEFDTLGLSSYGEAQQSSGVVSVTKPLSKDVSARKVLILDDVFETGRSLSFAKALVMEAGAASVLGCVFAYKAGKGRGVPDQYAWDAPDEFLIGYGMDAAGRYRGLPDIMAH